MKKIIFYQDILEQKQTSGLITTLDELSIYYSTLDTITYWLAECRKLINKLCFPYNIFHFDILISGKTVEYFYNIPEEREISKLLTSSLGTYYTRR